MATRFTPITSGAPQGGGEIDNLISAIQSIRQMRKQMKEDEWQAKLRAYQEIQQKRTLLEQGKADDAERSAAEYQGRINSMLTNPQPQGGFSLADVDLLATQGKMSKEQYSMLRERASDYVPDSQRLVNFSMMIPNITDEATFASAVQQTGVDFGEAMRLWNESKEGKGSAGNGEPQPKPEPKPKPEPDLLQSQAVAVNTLDKMKTTGLVIDGVKVKAKPGGTKKSFETPAVEIKDADGYTWQQTNTGTYVWLDGKWKKAEKDGKKYKSTKGRNLTLSETYSKIIDKGYEELQKAMIEGKGKKAMNSGNIVGDIIGDY
jgi:hypothetical protein